jgi:ankyrin repeat protein
MIDKVAKFLLESKAKASTADKNGWTAAVWALAMGHLGVLQVLADFGVRTRHQTRARGGVRGV